MKEINSSNLYDFIDRSTRKILSEIDHNDYLKKKYFGRVFSDDLLLNINLLNDRDIFRLLEEAQDYCNDNIFVLQNNWYAESSSRNCFLFVCKIEMKFFSIYKVNEDIDFNVSSNPLPFCEKYILIEKQHEYDTIKALKTHSEETPGFFGYSFHFIDDLFY